MKKHIPNILTLANLFCGCLAIIILMNDYFQHEFKTGKHICLTFMIIGILILFSLLFDFADGLVARLLNVKSELGAQLDSLADMVSFGVLPGFVMMYFLKYKTSLDIENFQYLGLLITLFSAIRLAKFNIDDSQTENFKGLNVPANTIFIVSLAYINKESWLGEFVFNPITLVLITFLSCYLLVSNIPMFSFKMKNFNFLENVHRYLLLIISIILLMVFQLVALPLIIVLYIVLSIIFKKKFV